MASIGIEPLFQRAVTSAASMIATGRRDCLRNAKGLTPEERVDYYTQVAAYFGAMAACDVRYGQSDLRLSIYHGTMAAHAARLAEDWRLYVELAATQLPSSILATSRPYRPLAS